MSSSTDLEGPSRQQLVRKSLEDHVPVIERLMEIGNTPGVSISVLCDDKVVFERGYGHVNLRTGVEATPDTVYAIASITKTFASAACGVLVSEGKLSWHDPISTYLPDLSLPDHPEIEKNATLVDILSHLTGLEDQATLFEGPNGMPLFVDEDTTHRALNKLSAGPGSFRQSWSYCPSLYALITNVIEKVSGTTLAEVFATRIFIPLGMLSTSVIGSEPNVQCHVATPYSRTSQGAWIERSFSPKAYQYPYDSSMGIQSTVVDMMKWARAVSASYNATHTATARIEILPEMNKILKRWSQLPSNEGGDPAYGLGWFVHNGHYIFDDMFDEDGQSELLDWPCTLPKPQPSQAAQTILYHSGIGHGFTSSLHVYPDKRDAVVVLGNSSHGGDAVDCISRLVTALVCGQDISIPNLEANLKFYTDLELGRWQKVDKDLDDQKARTTQERAIPASSDIIGCYLNDDINIEIIIVHDSRALDTHTQNLRPFIDAKVKFGRITNIGLRLWNFCDDTLCFFPSEDDYQRWGMSYMVNWAEYLIHLSREEDSGQVSGIWWQFDSSKDAIWFRRVEHSV